MTREYDKGNVNMGTLCVSEQACIPRRAGMCYAQTCPHNTQTRGVWDCVSNHFNKYEADINHA